MGGAELGFGRKLGCQVAAVSTAVGDCDPYSEGPFKDHVFFCCSTLVYPSRSLFRCFGRLKPQVLVPFATPPMCSSKSLPVGLRFFAGNEPPEPPWQDLRYPLHFLTLHKNHKTEHLFP